MGDKDMKQICAGVLAGAVALASGGSAMAWEPAPGGDPAYRITVTTIAEVGMFQNLAFAVLAEALPPDCRSVRLNNPRLHDNWLGIRTFLPNDPGGEIGRYQALLMFARAQNARVQVTIGGANPDGGGCWIDSVSTCFDANNCVLPPAP